MCAHGHGTCTLCKNSVSKYLSGLACMQASLNLEKITASYSWVLNTQNDMPNMIPIAYLNENFTDCSENMAWGKQEPLFHPCMFWYETKERKKGNTSFTFFSCSNHNFESFQIIFSSEYQHTSTVECCRLCSPCRVPKQPVWILRTPLCM